LYPQILRKSLNFSRGGDQSHGLPPAMAAAILLLPILLIFVLVSSQTGFNRHLRYLLPAYPFLFIAISVLLRCRQPLIRSAISILVVIQILSVAWHGPHWLSYFNELAGGPKA